MFFGCVRAFEVFLVLCDEAFYFFQLEVSQYGRYFFAVEVFAREYFAVEVFFPVVAEFVLRW